MIHPDTEPRIVSKIIGLGVFATADIPIGTIVYAKDNFDITISPEQFEQLPDILKVKSDRYSVIEPNGSRVLAWDSAKFTNHSCDANTLSTGYGFEIAVRDISAGEEITDDYGMFNMIEDMDLYCGCRNCRKVLRAGDFEQYVPFWDERVSKALLNFRNIEQPLLDLVCPSIRARLFHFLDTGLDYASVAELQLRDNHQNGNGQNGNGHVAVIHAQNHNGFNINVNGNGHHGSNGATLNGSSDSHTTSENFEQFTQKRSSAGGRR